MLKIASVTTPESSSNFLANAVQAVLALSVFDLILLGITLLALVLAVRQYRQAAGQRRRLREQQRTTDTLQTRLSTLEGEKEKRVALETALGARKDAEAGLLDVLNTLRTQLDDVENAYRSQGLLGQAAQRQKADEQLAPAETAVPEALPDTTSEDTLPLRTLKVDMGEVDEDAREVN